MTPAHASVLMLLKQLTRPYVSGPLPEWDTFARATRLAAVDARQSVPSTERDVYMVVRGVVKLVNADPDSTERGRVEEIFEAPTLVAPNLRPQWASTTGAPFSIASWRGRRWAIPSMEIVTIERSHLLWFDYRVVERLASRHPQWGQVVSAFLWTYVEGLFSANRDHSGKDVEGLYRDILAHRSSMLRRVTQRDLASYLGVTESALSRIARRVREGQGA